MDPVSASVLRIGMDIHLRRQEASAKLIRKAAEADASVLKLVEQASEGASQATYSSHGTVPAKTSGQNLNMKA